MGFLSGILGLAGAGIDAGVGMATAKKQYEYQRQLNQQQDDYNTQMSNTQYQRSTQDMLKAGLNPALMFNSGGPDVASASSGGSAPNVSQAVGHPASTAVQSYMQSQQAQQSKAQTEQLQAQTAQIRANTANTVSKTAAEVQNISGKTRSQSFERDLLANQASQIGQNIRLKHPDEQSAQVLSQMQGVSHARALNQLLSEGFDTFGKTPAGAMFNMRSRQIGKIRGARSQLRS